jgi:hypothetical protein
VFGGTFDRGSAFDGTGPCIDVRTVVYKQFGEHEVSGYGGALQCRDPALWRRRGVDIGAMICPICQSSL